MVPVDTIKTHSLLIGSENSRAAALAHSLQIFLVTIGLMAIPLSISLTYIFLFSGVLIWLFQRENLKVVFESSLVRPLIILVAFGCFSSIFGINPINSLVNLARLAFLILMVAYFCANFSTLGINRLLPVVFLASAVASFHSLLESAFPNYIEKFFVGTVTESGQLTLLIPCLAGFIFATNIQIQGSLSRRVKLSLTDILLAVIALLVFATLGFSYHLGVARNLKFLLVALAAAIFVPALVSFLWKFIKKNLDDRSIYSFCLRVAAPLLLCALLVNLKRGPWFGVTLALLIFFFFYHRRLIIPCVLGLLAVTFTIAPITERLSQSSQDFFILGGRSTIWEVGAELATQYPLGIGFTNSSFLREFAPEVPPELVHFHNNFLNILVEFGWIGLLIFLWWIFEIIRFCFAERKLNYKALLARGIGCSIIAWQLAGVVEYNFGDSEILILVFLLIGLVLANNGVIACQLESPCSVGQTSKHANVPLN